MKTDALLAVGLGLILGGSAWGLALRHRVEASNRGAAVFVDWQSALPLGGFRGAAGVYERVKEAGATGVAFPVWTLSELVGQGRAVCEYSGGVTEILVESRFAGHLSRAATLAGMGTRVSTRTGVPMHWSAVAVSAHPAAVLPLAVGYESSDMRDARAAGLDVLARIPNMPGASPDAVRFALDSVARAGATGYLPVGDTVLGYRSGVQTTAASLRDAGLLYYTPEFARIAGDTALAAESLGNCVRLHAIQQAEMDKMSPGSAVERMVKAVRERNVRALLVRVPDSASVDGLEGTERFLRSLRASLYAAGSRPRDARPLADPAVPAASHVVVGAGVGLVAMWCLASMWPAAWLPGLLLAALCAAGGSAEAGRPWVALAAAISGPVAGLLLVFRGLGVAGTLAAGFGLPLAAGMAVGSLLASPAYMASVSVFPGVKLAQVLPIAVAGALALRNVGGWRAAAGQAVTWGAAAASLAAVAALAFMVVRTGNDNPAAVSSLELQFRSLLDRFFFARPRTKEFLVGNPALVVGALLSARRPGSPWAAALFVVGSVGMTSITNTFCHLHTPVQLSVARTAAGLVLGGILGLAVWAVLGRRLRREAGADAG